MKYLSLLFFIALSLPATAQKLDKTKMAALANDALPNAIEELREFLAIPNDGHFPEQAAANLIWVEERFKNLGFKVQPLETGGIPLLFAEKPVQKKKAKTVLFYLQIDGQPVNPASWNQADPFQAVLKQETGNGFETIDWSMLQNEVKPDYRIFARSSSDSKGPAMSFITALQIAQDQKMRPNYNIKVIMDFQEEMSSPTTAQAVLDYQDLLQADMLVIMDGTRHSSNLPTLTFGARGIAKLKLTVFGPRKAMHSGQYGNYVPNPAFKLSKILAGMKDDDGLVTIPGYYDRIQLSPEEKAIMNDVPESVEEINRSVGIAKAEQVGGTLQEAYAYPSLNIRGMQAAWVGKEARTIIPDQAVAEIDIRLVPESDPERLIGLVRKYIADLGYHFVDGIPTEEERQNYNKLISFESSIGYNAFRTPYESEIGQFLKAAHIRAFGQAPVSMRTTGGSQPMAPFVSTLGVQAVAVRISNPGNNIHAPNENFRIGNYLEGIQTCLSILSQPLK